MLYVSAQRGLGYDCVTVAIIIGETVVKTATSCGPYTIAAPSGGTPRNYNAIVTVLA